MANTSGEKELKTDWDAQTASDETKYIGHVIRLQPQGLNGVKSTIPEGYREGID